MMDEPKEPPKAGGGGESPAHKPSSEAAGVPPTAKAEPGKPSQAPAPAGGGAAPPAKPAAPPPKPPAAAAKAPVKPEPWASPLLDELQRRFPGAVSEATIFRKMPSLVVVKESLVAMCEFLKSDEGGAYTLLTDQTAVDYPKLEKRFDVIYHLYSFKRNDRLRLKIQAGDGEKVPSVVGVWVTANWLEREVYDMFGVVYEGHPGLKRILLPDEWVGHPLRKDYDILKQDAAWVKANLGVESGQ